jgi:hypothetical protein
MDENGENRRGRPDDLMKGHRNHSKRHIGHGNIDREELESMVSLYHMECDFCRSV